MNAKQIEVHDYYKSLHPKALILYHLPGQYLILGNDVNRALQSLSTIRVLEPGVGIMPDDKPVLSIFGKTGDEVCVINYLNDGSVLDLPDISRIKSETDMDY